MYKHQINSLMSSRISNWTIKNSINFWQRMQINRNMGWDEIKGSILINDKAGWNIYFSLSLSPLLCAACIQVGHHKLRLYGRCDFLRLGTKSTCERSTCHPHPPPNLRCTQFVIHTLLCQWKKAWQRQMHKEPEMTALPSGSAITTGKSSTASRWNVWCSIWSREN